LTGAWRRLARPWLVQGVLAATLFLAIGAWQTRHVPSGPAPDFEAPATDGRRLRLSDWRADQQGRPVLIYFWAEWCPICRAVAGSVDDLDEAWPVLTVAMQSGSPDHVAGALGGRTRRWTTVVDPEGAIARQYGFSGVPAYVIVDSGGRIRFSGLGLFSGPLVHLRLWWLTRFG